MRKCLLLITLVLASVVSAQEIVPYFTSMPENILPYLSVSQRKDMVDYKVAGRSAIVKNLLGKSSELTFLSDRLLKLSLSDNAWFEMALFSNKKNDVIIGTIQTTLVGQVKDSKVVVYDGSWKVLDPLKYYESMDNRDLQAMTEYCQRQLLNSLLIQRGVAYSFNIETLRPERTPQFHFYTEKNGIAKDTIIINK